MNRRVRKSMLKDAALPPTHISEIIPADQMPYVREYHVGRNDSCPCGSEVKYKNCCLVKGTYENYK